MENLHFGCSFVLSWIENVIWFRSWLHLRHLFFVLFPNFIDFGIWFNFTESSPWDNSGNYLIWPSTRNRDVFPNYHIWFDAFQFHSALVSNIHFKPQVPGFGFFFLYCVYDLSMLSFHLIIYYLLLHFHQRYRWKWLRSVVFHLNWEGVNPF